MKTANKSDTFTQWLEDIKHLNQLGLSQYLSQLDQHPKSNLHQAINYVLSNPGKQIRSALIYATGELYNIDTKLLTPLAIAVESIHSYSLIHDDLPAMDDDDLRRGKPSCHKAFDEATAILAGDALQALSFEIIASHPALTISSDRKIKMIEILAKSCGPNGMVLGQSLDIISKPNQTNHTELDKIHALKTGLLFQACTSLVELIITDSDLNDWHPSLEQFSYNFGMCFQIKDDLLDISSSTEQLGKPQGSDQHNNKTTYPSLMGYDNAEAMLQTYLEKAKQQLQPFGCQANRLLQLTQLIADRNY